MTNTEAIKILKTAILLIDSKAKVIKIEPQDELYRYREAINKAVESLTETMKVRSTWKNSNSKYSQYYHDKCPNIKVGNIPSFPFEYAYCPNCGEKMFKEVNEE